MPRRARSNPVRLGIATSLLSLALLLSACQNAVMTGVGTPTKSSAVPTAASPRTLSPRAATLNFDDASLPAGAQAHWRDDLAADPGWSASLPAADQPQWAYATQQWQYTSADGTCTARFWEGAVPTGTATDTAASDAILAAFAATDPAASTGLVVNGGFQHANTGNADVSNRALIYDATDGHAVAVMARSFQAAGLEFISRVDCATRQQAWSTGDEAITKTPILVR